MVLIPLTHMSRMTEEKPGFPKQNPLFFLHTARHGMILISLLILQPAIGLLQQGSVLQNPICKDHHGGPFSLTCIQIITILHSIPKNPGASFLEMMAVSG